MSARFTDLVGVELPIVQAPMAGFISSDLVVAVAEAGGLGSLPCALLSPEEVRREVGLIRARTSRPINVNFFCHARPVPDDERLHAWRDRLTAYSRELGLDPEAPLPEIGAIAFDESRMDVIEELRPEVVSFQFGLPAAALVDRVRAAGALVLSTATTVEEARWLEDHGCDAVIAQGSDAGGHRGMFLGAEVATQVGTMALVPQVVDAVEVPVVAAGGIADGRGVAAAIALGADAVQLGTAFLVCPEATTGQLHRDALAADGAERTALTNVLTGRPARSIVNRVIAEVGPLTDEAPPFPLASAALLPLRAAAEAKGSTEFSSLWAGQAARLARSMPAGELVRLLADEASERLRTALLT